MQNTSLLTTSLTGITVTCPTGHATGTLTNGNCRTFSIPRLYNDVFWQNRSFFISVGSLGTGTQNQQNVVSLYTGFANTAAASQPAADAMTANGAGAIITGGTGACVTPNAAPNYWDIGVRGDTLPTTPATGNPRLAPIYSAISSGGYTGTADTTVNPTFISQYCNGSRVPPENGGLGYQVPPGISDATVPNPIFNLTPAATVDEGNNWINISWGPLAMTGPVTGSTLGNYGLTSTSVSVINLIPSTAGAPYTLAPSTDFYGNLRKTNNAVDAGAVEYVATGTTAIAAVTGGPLSFGSVLDGTTSTTQILTLHNTGTAPLTGITLAFTGPFSRATAAQGGAGSCGATLAAGTICTMNVVFSPTTPGAVSGTLTITASVTVLGSPVALSGTGVAATHTASVSPSPLAFGNWATGTTSNPLTLTVTNTGNSALAGGTFTFGGGTPQPFARPAGTAGGTCAATLAVGASCTIRVTFAPTTAVAYSRTLTVAYTGATVTPTPVTLTGTGVATRGTLGAAPNPLTITLPTGTVTGTGIVTITNTTTAGGSSVAVTNIATTGGTVLTYFFNVVAGSDNCTGTNLAPGASCSVTIRFTNVLSARGTNRAGNLVVTDTATGSPQSFGLIGHAD